MYTIIATKVLSIASFNVANIKGDKQTESDKILKFYGPLNDLFKNDFDKIDKKIRKIESLICYLKIILWGLLILFFIFGIYETFYTVHVESPVKVTIAK